MRFKSFPSPLPQVVVLCLSRVFAQKPRKLLGNDFDFAGLQHERIHGQPGCSSPPPITIDGFELRSSFDACSGVNEMRAASHVMRMCGT